jgi:hypothetical protein
MIRQRLILRLFTVGFIMLATCAFAGTGMVKFGANAGGGGGCTGTGICQTGTGAAVTFNYYQNLDTAGGTYTRLGIVVNYQSAAANGFSGSASGGAYTFTNGYSFDHASDQGSGVPSNYAIPAGYVCNYQAPDKGGNIYLVISQFVAR